MDQTLINNIDKKINELNAFLVDKKIEELTFPTEWAFYFIMERYFINIKTIKVLIPRMQKDILNEIPIGLILRTSLLDSLIALDLFCLSKDADNLEVKIRNLLIDNIINTVNYFDELNKYEEIDITDVKSVRAIMDKGLQLLLSKMGIKDIDELMQEKDNHRFNSPKAIFKQLMNSKYKTYAKCYDYYNYYSKYEHFGVLYPMFSRRDYNEKIIILRESIEYIFLIIDILTSHKENSEV